MNVMEMNKRITICFELASIVLYIIQLHQNLFVVLQFIEGGYVSWGIWLNAFFWGLTSPYVAKYISRVYLLFKVKIVYNYNFKNFLELIIIFNLLVQSVIPTGFQRNVWILEFWKTLWSLIMK